MKFTQHLLVLAAALAALTVTAPASAACVQGKVRLYWELGNFCSTASRDCTGWYYTDASQDTLQALREVKLEIRDSSGDTLAVGNSNNTGNYSMCYTGSPASVSLIVIPEHFSDAFKIHNSSGDQWTAYCVLTGLGSGTNARDCAWGSNGAPNAVLSVYETAYIALKNSVNTMGGASSGFTNVSIRMDKSASNTNGYDKIINITDASELNFATVMHEMGHVSTAMASRSRYLGTDSSNKGAGIVYDACGGDGSASFTSTDECKDAVWVESIAEVFGAWARQSAATVEPCTGRSGRGTSCHAGGSDLEDIPTCASRMRILDAIRYFWDTFDSTGVDGVVVPKGEFDDILYRYPGGRDNHTKDENWCCTFWSCWPCDHDDKNMSDWEHHLQNEMSIDIVGLLGTNCSS